LTVLFGLNGAGKTALLDCLHAGLTGLRRGLDGRPLPDDADVAVLVEADDVIVDTLRDAVFWHGRAESHLGPRPDLIDDFRASLIGSTTWAYWPDEREGVGWTRAVAATPAAGTIARHVFELDQTLKRAARDLRTGDAKKAQEILEGWPLAAWVEGQPPDALERVVRSAAVYNSNPRAEHAESHDFCAMDADDGLPIALMGTELPVSETDAGLLALQVVTEDPNDHGDGLNRLRVALSVASEGAWLATAGGWVPHPPETRADGPLTELMQQEDNPLLPAVIAAYLARQSLTLWFEHIRNVVNGLLSRFLFEPPTLIIDVDESLEAAYSGQALRWVTDRGVPLERLSRAERRWARLIIDLVTLSSIRLGPEQPDRPPSDESTLALTEPTFVLLDEPEAALHRAAEERMAAGLHWLAAQPSAHVVVATHSPSLLDEVHADVFRIHGLQRSAVRDGTLVEFTAATATRLTAVTRSNMAALGLQPSDLLRRHRAFLLVEGHHDALLLEHFLGEQLRRLRVHVLPLRGARALPDALDSRFLFDFTDAIVVPVLDNLSAERIREIWEQALVMAAAQGAEPAGVWIRAQLPARASSENQFMGQFLSRAVQSGLDSRVAPFGLSAADILEYLPVSAFARRASSWDALREEHRLAVAEGSTRVSNWKDYVSARHATDFSDERLLAAAAAMAEPPRDFVALLSFLRLHLTD
jgi:predicted ATPase